MAWLLLISGQGHAGVPPAGSECANNQSLLYSDATGIADGTAPSRRWAKASVELDAERIKHHES
jgi:hypothetical protein